MAQNTKQKTPKGASRPSLASKAITDPRFSNIQTDPRYRLPSKRTTHVKLDQRFSHMLRDDDFLKKASVDRYGRPLPKDQGRKELERFYIVDEDEQEERGLVKDDDETVRRELERVERKYDPAREGGFSESSSDEDESSEYEEAEAYAADEAGVEGGVGRLEEVEVPMGDVSSRIAVVNLDWDNIKATDIMAVASSFCPPQGRILKVTIYTSEFGRERMERENMEGPAPELFASSSKHPTNSDRHAPPLKPAEDSDTDSAATSDSESSAKIKSSLLAQSTAEAPEVESRALRAYQLSRLRYYYAVITCNSTGTASALYAEMDGREYLSSANFFDLRFIPDSVTFDDPVADRPRDECDRVSSGYKPKEFVTEALRHSKVRLTWDEDDPGRKEVQKRAFSREEIDENDLMTYVGSDSAEDESDLDDADNGAEVDGLGTTAAKGSKALAARHKLRAALGLASESAPSKALKRNKAPAADEAGGGMQVTFTAGISSQPAAGGAVFQNRPEDVHEETTRERYIRKERERKARRKAKGKAKHDGLPAHGSSDSDASVDDRATEAAMVPARAKAKTKGDGEEDADDPFNDPFFTDPTTANAAARKATKAAKRAAAASEAEANAARKQREREELELLMAGEGGEGAAAGARAFDMAEIRKAEKEGKRKGRKGGKEGRDGGGDEFEVDVEDPRFKAVFESHEFAIDPSNPRFSGTRGMKSLLDQGRKKRRVENGGSGVDVEEGAAGKGGLVGNRTNEGKRRSYDDLDALVNKIKRKKAA